MALTTLRCPNCGQSVSLPAESCPCGYNFRTGENSNQVAKGQELNATSSKLHLILGGVAIGILLVLMAIFFFRSPSPPPARNLAPAPSVADSPSLKPQNPIGQAKEAASLANDNRQRLAETQEEIDSERR